VGIDLRAIPCLNWSQLIREGNQLKSIKTWIGRIAALAALAIPTQTLAQAQPATKSPHYNVIDLGTLGGSYSYGYGINNAGWVAGAAATPDQTGGLSQTGFLWYDGQMTNLGTLGGSACSDCSSEAGGPNASGESVLFSETSNPAYLNEDFCAFGTHRQCLGAVWKNGVMTALPPLAGGYNSAAYWINNRGQVAGFAENGTADPTCSTTPFQVLRFEAAIWGADGKVRELLRTAAIPSGSRSGSTTKARSSARPVCARIPLCRL
jgi:probable HAF family extracellular repeat protein